MWYGTASVKYGGMPPSINDEVIIQCVEGAYISIDTKDVVQLCPALKPDSFSGMICVEFLL